MNNNKIILLTGATSGIGKATAMSLAREGYRLVFTARNESKAEQTREEIIRNSGNQNIQYLIGDLSLQSDVRKVADEFRSGHDHLDILINNAGGYFHTRKTTGDGFEYTFALNHLGYFSLTLRLLDLMRKSPSARIVNVASEASRYGHMDFGDLMAEKKYSGIKAYCQSKLANLLFTYELDRRLTGTGITVNALHPGTVNTNFAKNTGGFAGFLVRLYTSFVRSAEKGAETVIYLAESGEVGGISGKYFYDRKEIKSLKESYDLTVAGRLWEKSLELTYLVREEKE